MTDMKSVIKFMKKEELIEMLVKIRNWKHPDTKRFLKKYRTCEECWANEWTLAEYKFNMKNLDFVDVLICNEGYVRYYYSKRTCAVDMLIERFGFIEE